MFLEIFPSIFLGTNGLYYVVAACVPFDSVFMLGRAGVKIESLDTGKARASTFFAGLFYIVIAIVIGVLFNARQIGMSLHG